MPKVKRNGLPPRLFDHILDRVRDRSISAADLEQMTHWLDKDPTVPDGKWFKRFDTFIVCGRGEMIRTVLKSSHSAVGEEV